MSEALPNTAENDDDQDERRFYVYALRRTYRDTGRVELCYIGRGTRRRSERHILELRRGTRTNPQLQG
jgi:hypothetical protein